MSAQLGRAWVDAPPPHMHPCTDPAFPDTDPCMAQLGRQPQPQSDPTTTIHISYTIYCYCYNFMSILESAILAAVTFIEIIFITEVHLHDRRIVIMTTTYLIIWVWISKVCRFHNFGHVQLLRFVFFFFSYSSISIMQGSPTSSCYSAPW